MVDFSGISRQSRKWEFSVFPSWFSLPATSRYLTWSLFYHCHSLSGISSRDYGSHYSGMYRSSGRDIKMEELQGSLAVDGFSSAISGCFGCPPLTSFSQNVGLVTMTGVINRFTIFTGALILILASLFPPLGAFFNSLPQAVLGGCTVMMFGSIMYEGIKMLKECEFDDRTMIIVSLAFCIGVGLTQTSGNFFAAFPQVVGDVFNGNAVAGVFVVFFC